MKRERMVHFRMHAMEGKQFMSCCDAELLGKRFTEGKTCLRITEEFFKGTEVPVADATNLIKDHMNACNSVHIIGENIITNLDKCGLISKDGVKRVCNIPHVMWIKI
nr:DUF424 family protein [Candidatus Sigynarchaeota archaeon]